MDRYTTLPCTLEAALEVASNLRQEDRREIEEGWGYDPMELLPTFLDDDFCVYFTAPNGRTAGMGGINGTVIWMVTTPVIHDYPIGFVKEAKRVLATREEPILGNVVDKRNTVHLRLLKYLGFKFLREISHGPNQLTFIEFCRVLRS